MKELNYRQEKVFVILTAFFLGSMTLLNVIGITRFIHLGPLALAVGVLPYPLTFLCTDLISELYGQKRANFVVWVGLALNVFVIATLTAASWLPSVDLSQQPPWQTLFLSQPVSLANGKIVTGQIETFDIIYACTAGSVFASMLAYVAAQFCDVWLFHFWKRLTKGKHLWLRNNFSTLISQMVDSIAVISITFWSAFASGKMSLAVIGSLMLSNYLFKMVAALVDTIPFYIGVLSLRKYLGLKDSEELV